MGSVVTGLSRARPFLNRVGAKAAMETEFGVCTAEGRPCLLYLHGPDGIGRMSLVSEFSHQHQSAFDTYVEVAARQPDGRLVQAGEMLGQALRALGVPDTELPAGLAERAFAFQQVSAGKRLLLVVRDVADVEQVVNLIPHSAPGAAMLVTGRAMLRGLLLHDFVDVPLSKLPREDAKALLVTSMGSPDVPAPVVDGLAEICDDIPLLIRILGAQLRRRPVHAVERHLRELRASDAALLTTEHSQRVGRILEVADGLVRDLRLALRQLALLPGPDFGVAAAAVAMETDGDRAEQVLEKLVDSNLLVCDPSGQRYSFYRIVRAHARSAADQVEGPEKVRAAVERIATWYLREAIPRDAALANRWRVGREFERFAAADLAPVSREAAIAWFDVEWASVVACVRAAHDQALHEITWQLCVAVFKYLHLHGHVDAWIDSHTLGIRSAEMPGGDVAGLMQVTSQRGAAYLAIGKTELAAGDFDTSLRAAVEAGHPNGEQSAWEWKGKTAAADRDVELAFRCFDESEAVIDRAEREIPADQRVRMRALLRLQRARTWAKLDDWTRAADSVSSVVNYFETIRETDNHAKCLMVLGDAAFGCGDLATAVGHYRRAAELFERDQTLRAQAIALHKLGTAKLAEQDFAGAAEALRPAEKLYLMLGDARADAVTELLRPVEN